MHEPEAAVQSSPLPATSWMKRPVRSAWPPVMLKEAMAWLEIVTVPEMSNVPESIWAPAYWTGKLERADAGVILIVPPVTVAELPPSTLVGLKVTLLPDRLMPLRLTFLKELNCMF